MAVANKYQKNTLNEDCVLYKENKDGGICKAFVSPSHPVNIKYSKKLEIVRVYYYYYYY